MADEKHGQGEKRLHELLTSSMVDIYVGAESTHWPLHERLLCYHSPFFASIFYDENAAHREGHKKSYGLPDEDELPFEMLVGWLYSRSLQPPREEKDVGPLLDLYLLADKLEVDKLASDVVETIRDFYHSTSTYPGLRRVQYIYSNTSEDNSMREMMVGSIARYLTLGDTIPKHWANALKKNGQLAVDIIRAIQEWHLESRSVPDARDASADRGRTTKGFSAVVDERGTSHETAATGVTDESVDHSVVQGDGPAAAAAAAKPEANGEANGEANDLPTLPERPKPPDSEKRDESGPSSSQREQEQTRVETAPRRRRWPSLGRPEYIVLSLLWAFYSVFSILAYRNGGT